MSTKIADLIIELAVNPCMFKEFTSDPDHVLDSVGLTTEEKAIIKDGNSKQICEYIGKKLGKDTIYPSVEAPAPSFVLEF
jgi:hypothetical protein